MAAARTGRVNVRVTTIGYLARAALARSGATARIVAPLSASLYLDAAGELIWLGRAGATLHARAALGSGRWAETYGERADAQVEVRLEIRDARTWRPEPLIPSTPRAAIRERARALAAEVVASRAPAGFGALLAARRLEFPLATAAGRARDVASACASGDAAGAERAAGALIGLGPGLTPAGDDYVGGALFARATLGVNAPDAAGGHAWRDAIDRLLALATVRTNRISAVLLADLAAGRAYAPLHEIAVALAGDAEPARAADAARRLTRIGHSSGWDVLAGFLGVLAA